MNCVAPGLVPTPLSQFLTTNEAARKASVAMHPLGRLGEPGDVASAICWLLSPEQKWVTGQVLHVDGGPTGVELAGAFAELTRHVLRRDFRRIDPGQARIILR